MRTVAHIIAFTLIIICLCNTSCVTVRASHIVHVEDIAKMQPFEATVESIEITHPFFVSTAVDIILKKTNDGKQLDLQMGDSQNAANFATSLRKGESYTFPQILVDYMNSHSTNSVAH